MIEKGFYDCEECGNRLLDGEQVKCAECSEEESEDDPR